MACNTSSAFLISPIPPATPIARGERNLPPSYHHHHHQKRRIHVCKASSSSSSSSGASKSLITEFDLYDMLGIDSSSDQKEIKKAYRSLQKRCHPDIAGAAGHDMAIILNEVYALLSDPISRSAYDKEQKKTAELRGYTGRPMYSVWKGPETEQRAVFVDEVKCVGCLKCALLADKTFAIENVYGRARVVAQWADPEPKIQASIEACPVDCISIVERSDLAALEFLMSKQPRGSVRIGASNTGGTRVFDVFSEVKVLHKRLEEATNRKSYRDSKYSEPQRDARISAIQAIRSITNWLYWQSPTATSEASSSLTLSIGAKRSFDPDIDKLREAAAEVRRHGMLKTEKNTGLLSQQASMDEYWTPSTPILPRETKNSSSVSTTTQMGQRVSTEEDGNGTNFKKTFVKKEENRKSRSPIISRIPMGIAVLAAVVVRLQGVGEGVGGLEEHVGGSLALHVVNSSWLPVILAGVTWYLIASYVVQLIEGLASRGKVE